MKAAMPFFLLAAGAWAETVPAVVLQPVANMYSRAADDADVVSQAIYGSNVSILERQPGWARIRTADDYTGWTPLSALREGQRYPAAGRTAETTSLFAHIYREASVTRHRPLLTVPFETRLEVVAEPPADDGRWLAVRLADDRAGWVQRGDISFKTKPIGIPEMIELSKRFLGLPYTWGGTSSYGYDCSGFAQMLCRRRGISMPRDAQPQSQWSGLAPVGREKLQPGDLLYFGPSDRKITHTGVYIGGNRFINATTHLTPMVRIDDLTDPHWAKLLVACRRPKS
jgi:gamma-D-glutamyl-L-lysine dipeptidyl-peptidase